jgi:hypothetical protein
LSAFKPITSTNQNSFAAIALKAIAEMQASADSNKTCNAFGFGTLAHEHQCLNIHCWMPFQSPSSTPSASKQNQTQPH